MKLATLISSLFNSLIHVSSAFARKYESGEDLKDLESNLENEGVSRLKEDSDVDSQDISLSANSDSEATPGRNLVSRMVEDGKNEDKLYSSKKRTIRDLQDLSTDLSSSGATMSSEYEEKESDKNERKKRSKKNKKDDDSVLSEEDSQEKGPTKNKKSGLSEKRFEESEENEPTSNKKRNSDLVPGKSHKSSHLTSHYQQPDKRTKKN